MLPLAHTYVSTNVTKRKNDILIFGSVLPDIATTSKGSLGRQEIHNSPLEIYEFIKKEFPTLIDLGLGIMLHSDINKGADFYTDNRETGFAYINGKFINSQVAEMLNIEPDDKTLVLSHNFIEASIDILISHKSPEYIDLYKHAMEDIDINEISNALSAYLKIDSNILKKEIENLKLFLNYKHLNSIENVVDNIAGPLIKIRLEQDFDRNMAVDILKKSIELVENSYEDFLNRTVTEMKITFEKYL